MFLGYRCFRVCLLLWGRRPCLCIGVEWAVLGGVRAAVWSTIQHGNLRPRRPTNKSLFLYGFTAWPDDFRYIPDVLRSVYRLHMSVLYVSSFVTFDEILFNI